MIDGFVVIDKPRGVTSHDVVNIMRKKFNMRRVGHAGTLDPLATGVLVILLGRSTKLFGKFSSFSKAYDAVMTLGLTTTTADINGEVMAKKSYAAVTQERVEEIFKRFIGDIEQIPPMVSAVKVKGKRLYTLARKGLEIEREPRHIRIDSLQLVDYRLPEIKFYIECSKGTYIRKLAEDIGELLGCGACISQIRRMKVGPFGIDDAVTVDTVTEGAVRQWRE